MKDLSGVFSSKIDNWSTPQMLYDQLDHEFLFDLDPCADDHNHKCDLYFTKEQNGLDQDWSGHRVFCNPPYGKDISKWVRKAYIEGHKENTLVVMLIPARTDTAYFHDYILNRAEIRFLRGRLKFSGSSKPAPFPSILVIYRGMGVS